MSLPQISQKTLIRKPERRTRVQHLSIIRALACTEGHAAALVYWLQYCPRISRASFNAASA
jgi:hypothetical protein